MDEMEIQNPIPEVVPVSRKRFKKTECKVILVHPDMIGISFEGYGISFPRNDKTVEFKIGETVKVQYFSEIGKPDFEINIL
jgi:hypothetical protein